MARTRTSDEAMRHATAQLDDTVSRFQKSRSTVDTETQTLLTSWTGVAATKFGQAEQQWSEAFARLTAKLQTMNAIQNG